ncbi:hypothetical protein [Streptomyces sp. E2N171]|uniref:phage terminase large subunit family protein n=1 Tax=Streptomyces sp. E2N171 TaxID=1851914 RepID=UPI000EF567FF|nr:hypothetical protein [Streptomyces sp. E2N171]
MDIQTYITRYPKELLTRTEGRVALTRNDPLLFAYLYLPHHLTTDSGSQSLSAFHLDLIEYAKTWTKPVTKPREYRDCFIAPRNAGKSTWLFLLLPMWAAAHGHVKFVAAFSDSASQAEDHLQTFKTELDTNERLTSDFPDLCTPMMGQKIRRHVAQSSDQIMQANGFVFMAKGIDAKTLGMKVGRQRPDLLLFDDIEPPEATYSEIEASRRLTTLLDAALPLNIYARVAIVGTTTMPGSIIDQLRTVGEAKREWESEKPEISRVARNGGMKDVKGNHHLTTPDLLNQEVEGQEVLDQEVTEENGHRGVDRKSGTKVIFPEQAISTPFKNASLPENLADGPGEGLEGSLTASTPVLRPSVAGTSDRPSETPSSGSGPSLADTGSEAGTELGDQDQDARDFYESLAPEFRWVEDARIKVHYFPAIITNPDGSEESLWPEFWPLEDLNSIRHTRDFHKNYMNKPVSLSADYWQDADISIRTPEEYGNTVLCLDPAVKTAKTNDYTGIAVLSRGNDGKVYVRHAEGKRIPPGPELKDYVSDLCEKYNVGLVYVETNMGGDVWKSVLDGVPAKYKGIHNRESKPLRATKALDFYRKGEVFHTAHFETLQTQMYGYPRVKNDDVLDAVVSGVLYFLGKPQAKTTVKRQSYI